MRVPPFDRYRRWLAGFGLFLAGMVVGSAVYMSMHHHLYSVLVVQNATLKSELSAAKNDLKSIASTRNLQSRISVVKVTVEAAEGKYPLDELVRVGLRDRIQEDLQVAVGKPVSVVKDAPEVFTHLVDAKVYHGIRDKDYQVFVKMMVVVQSEMTVWLVAEQYLQP